VLSSSAAPSCCDTAGASHLNAWSYIRRPLHNLIFHTSAHARLFVILLGDFLSEIRAFKGELTPLGLKPAPSNARPSDLTFLFHLRQVCADPKRGADAGGLSATVEVFATWLKREFTTTGVNLHSIDVAADLRGTRYRYIKMCGDMAKHNLARLATNVGHLRQQSQALHRLKSHTSGRITFQGADQISESDRDARR
jgi:hypothetical protein